MPKEQAIRLGYEIGTGEAVAVPLRHMAVTGQTQQSGKTTTLEALISRAGGTALTFVTKRGEGSFADGRRVAPYFRDRADWKFVDELLEAVLQEKNKFLRPWIMRICRNTETLKEVQDRVREELLTAKGLNHGVFTQLDAYLEMVVPEIARAELAEKLDLKPGLNVMDVSDFATPMQMLFIQSALDWINARCRNTTVVIPEAWEFVPQGKGSPVKKSAETLVRKGGGLGNHIWLDSQDMAGVDKMVLRACTVWLIGVQREANEIKRNIANIPAGMRRPKPEDIASLERGQFFACFDKTIARVYVQPAWMAENAANAIAIGDASIEEVAPRPPAKPARDQEAKVTPQEAERLRIANDGMKREIEAQNDVIAGLRDQIAQLMRGARPPAAPQATSAAGEMPASLSMDAIYAEVKRRAQADPGLIKLLTSKPAIDVIVDVKTVEVDGATMKGRIVQLLARGFFDEGATNAATRTELKRTGNDANNGGIARVLDALIVDGFMTRSGDKYVAVEGMKVNIRKAA